MSPNGLADRLLWSAPLPEQAEGEAAVSADAVFTATDSGLVALNRASGQRLWFTPATGLSGTKRLLVRGRRVLSTGTYSVLAHDADTGRLLWEHPYAPDTDSPAGADAAADDDLIYVGLRSGREVALSQADGHTVWDVPIATTAWAYKGGVAGTLIAGDTLFVTATRYLTENFFQETAVVVALDRRTGGELWRHEVAATDLNADHAPGLAAGNVLFLDSYHGYVVAIDRATHTEKFRRLLQGFFFHGPVIRSDTLFAATSESRAYAINTVTGAPYWTAKLAQGATSVGVCGSELFVADFDVEVHAVSDGRSLGRVFAASNDEFVTSRIAVVEGVVYVGTTRRLLAFSCR